MVTTPINRKPAPPVKKSTLFDAPGAEVGHAVEWSVGNLADALTEREIELIRLETGVKEVNTARALAVKRLMPTHSIAQIAKSFRGRKGYGQRTIAGLHAALSKAKGEGLR